MKRFLSSFVVLILIFSGLPLNKAGLYAQNFVSKINSFPNQSAQISSNDTVKILAVMVNFQEDRDGTTFGNGKFESIYSKDYGSRILDPLPHDKSYFESHLTFVKNYFNKISNGKVNIQFTVLPDTFSVSQTMRNYAPPPNSNDFSPLAQFSEEVWTKADQMNPGFNFSDYNLFLIFHAGVGRDISLPGSLGNERDLPSVYLNENTLKNIYGLNFNGFPVSNGAFRITNSLIIPETESRELESLTGTVLFQITINGLLSASVASHLGLPDLFDTETGLSAIGRFGLMDGQAIFAYNGVFPPEPSVWEKVFLGWAEPIEISPGNYDVNLVTNLIASPSDTVILKVPLNSTEYYLIENRQRDAFKDGSKITLVSNGNIITKTFPKDTTGFHSFNTDSLYGVILDVDEYDWALPGSGILIWHIDNKIINEKIADNTINADENNRGVDLEEADGVQDIGKLFTTIFGDVVVGEGTDQDLWYSGNKATLYKNKFSQNTRPDTKTNSGANSLITIEGFSPIANKMSFKVEYGDSVVKPFFNYVLPASADLRFLTEVNSGNDIIFGIQSSSSLILADEKGILSTINYFSFRKPAAIVDSNKVYIIGVTNDLQINKSKINYLEINNGNLSEGYFEIDKIITTAPLIRKNSVDDLELLVGTDDGEILIYDLYSIYQGKPITNSEKFLSSDLSLVKLSADKSNIAAIGMSKSEPSYYFYFNDTSLKFSGTRLYNLISTLDYKGNFISVVSTSAMEYVIISNDKIITRINTNSFSSLYNYSFGDIKNDGNNYLIISDGNKLYSYNLAGGNADNFPQQITNNDLFSSIPLVADIEGDSKSEIIAITKNGNVFAYDGGTGKLVNGFPISFGVTLKTQPVMFQKNGLIGLAGIDESNKFQSWFISSSVSRIDWSEENGNSQNTSFMPVAKSSNIINQFFPTNRAYNYPNPVYGGQTAIRYYVNEDSKINIKIFDLAGSFVAELHNDAIGGTDNETIWNVSDIQSGVYLARIEAIGQSGKTESKIIKIAVVK